MAYSKCLVCVVSCPQVMQKCDGVMASGRNVTTFAIPALQPLVLTLFVRPSRESPDLETQREVVLNMLLRLVAHHRIISLLCYVLECYSHRRQQWQQVSVGGREGGELVCENSESPPLSLLRPSPLAPPPALPSGSSPGPPLWLIPGPPLWLLPRPSPLAPLAFCRSRL